MVAFGVFCVAAAIMALAPRLATREPRSGPRPEGIVFIAAVLGAASVGLLLSQNSAHQSLIRGALPLLGITAILYAASALRGASRLPPWLADFFVILAACATLYFDQPDVDSVRLPFTNDLAQFGSWSVPLTVAWVWAISRMTAALNRTPQVTGGYLGVVALTFILLLKWGPTAAGATAFPALASAALAGAGLVSVPVALRRKSFNIGWSAALAMGFLLAQIAVSGFMANTALAILTLLLLVFGLPLLDVSFYRLRASGRGANVTWEENHLRLHEALARRGISNTKIACIYLAATASLCLLGVILVRTATWNLALRIFVLAILLICGSVFFFSIIRVLMRRTADEEIPEDIEAFGMKITPVSMAEAIDKIEGMILSRTPHHIVTSDANAILCAQQDPEYAAIVRRAAMITPDGYGVMWGARLLNLPIYERVTGIDMVTGTCVRAAEKGYSIYILGSAPGVASTAAKKLAEAYPGLRVAGTQHGYFAKEEIPEEQIAAQIRDARPDVLFVAFGIPRQEKFIARHFATMNVPVSMGVGGSFDVFSENLKRAPIYVQRAGMEWLYRVWQEPWRWKRMGYVPRFMMLALRVWLFGSKDERGSGSGHIADS